MDHMPYDEDIEQRISMEILVDTYGDEEESLMGWYYYLQNNLHFPFQAKTSTGEIYEIIDLASEDECSLFEIWLCASEQEDELFLSLNDLTPIDADTETTQAMTDWHYWLTHHA